MPTKTDRILSYLPRIFKTAPRPAVLYPVADAFGNELLLAENSLAAIMLAHWVDFADKNALEIEDLAKLAALYGLAPWTDESGQTLETVEEFREHLKRYIRTFLEGTVTVQGILRITAEALALRIADAPEDLDRWWTRGQDSVVTVGSPGNEAAAQLNFEHSSASGSPALPAQVMGSVDLSEGINLQDTNILRLKIDGVLEEINLTAKLAPDAKLTLEDIIKTINEAPRVPIASRQGNYLKLASPTSGPTSKLEVINGPHDAVPRLLGLAPRSYHGAEATAARYEGTPKLHNPIDLTNERYLRLEIDRKHLQEIDCAGNDAAHTTLDQVRDKINNAFPGLTVASHDGEHLILNSPSKGFASVISVQPPAAQNAATKLLGVPAFFKAGLDALPARADSNRDLRGRIDLSERANLRLRIDGAASVNINCAGVEPEKTERVEIVAAINAALKSPAAFITERSISIASPTTGPTSEIVFEQPKTGDATFDIFGVGSLSFQGTEATVARLTAAPVFTGKGLDVRANYLLLLAIDGGAHVTLDLRQAARAIEQLRALPLDRVAEFINESLGGIKVASTDGQHLFLTSTRTGSISRLEIVPRETRQNRRFVTRATVIDEAARDVFGFFARESRGTAAVGARLLGERDLSLSADLTNTRFLRLRVDGSPALEIDCAGPRPRATTLAEIVSQINQALKAHGQAKDLATHDGKHLVLISPTLGASSQLAIEPPRAALDKVLGLEPGTTRGTDATTVRFTSTVDLTGGIDLQPNAAVKLGIDGAAPVEIVVGGATPGRRTPFDIVNAINTAFHAAVASSDGRRVELRSAKKGPESSIKFEAPAANDVTKEILGIVGPREYHGAAASPARVIGLTDLNAAVDLSVFRTLVIAFDGGPAQKFDCAAKAADAKLATLAEIVNSIGPTIASASPDGKLILSSPGTGETAQIKLEPFDEGDASNVLFGDIPLTSAGTTSLPAVITGANSLHLPVNLSRRGLLRIAVDGGSPVDIDIAGAVPAKTSLDEIINQINRAFPILATADADDKLQLTSPTTGSESKLSLQPLRFLDVVEYPLETAPPQTETVKHNGSWSIVNHGVAQSYAEIRITAPQGTVGPSVVNSGLGWSVHLFVVLERGETARLFRDAQLGLQAEVIAVDGHAYPIAPSQLLVGPLGPQAIVPFEKYWTLAGDGSQPSLQLNNPQAPDIVLLNSLSSGAAVTVEVRESDISSLPAQTIGTDGELGQLVGRLMAYHDGFQLVDASGAPIAELLAGPNIYLRTYLDMVVKVSGVIHSGTPPVLLVKRIVNLFDVKLHGKAGDEEYLRVSIGAGTSDEDSLVFQINVGFDQAPSSRLVRAEELDKATVLNLPVGKSNFRYLDCLGSRFDFAHFDRSRFPDGVCGERGIFDVSRFSNSPPERISAVFASADPFSDPPVKIEFRWNKFSAGSFTVNLPADLLPRFGGRFDDARFGQEKDDSELFEKAVAEPLKDERFLVKLISPESGQGSEFVKAKTAETVELGWTAAEMPFRQPQFLTLGGPGRAARLYLKEKGRNVLIKLEAKEEGAWGNEIAVSARQVGPAIYDVSVFYRGACFEQARSIVMGAVKQTVSELLEPGPSGVLQAKAAGVRADVTRDRADYHS